MIKILSNGYINIKTPSGRVTKSKLIYDVANWFINNYLKPIENRVKIWNHGKSGTGEIGNADFLVNLSWNQAQLTGGLDGLILRSRRDGAMKLIKFLREHPEYKEYI